MTRDETKKILAVLLTVFPNSQLKSPATVDVWASILEPYPYEAISKATYAYLRTDPSGWPIPAKILQYLPREEETDGQLWGAVQRAIRNGIYGSREEFEKLPELAKEAVGDPDNLRQWAMMDESSMTVVESNFYRRLAAAKTRKRNESLSLGVTQRKEIEKHD